MRGTAPEARLGSRSLPTRLLCDGVLGAHRDPSGITLLMLGLQIRMLAGSGRYVTTWESCLILAFSEESSRNVLHARDESRTIGGR
jgi:hypothetical protein